MSPTKTQTLQPIPYLSFDGNCAEAMHFYEKTLGGTIKVMMSGSQVPVHDEMAAAFGDRILNSQLELPGGTMLYGGDCPTHMPYEGIKGVSLTLNFDTVEEGEEIFNKLADGGQVFMPYAPTFWAEKFGVVTDKFGVTWVVNGVLQTL